MYQTINENDENIETKSQATEESEQQKRAKAENSLMTSDQCEEARHVRTNRERHSSHVQYETAAHPSNTRAAEESIECKRRATAWNIWHDM